MVNVMTTLSVVALYVETLLLAYLATQLYSRHYPAFLLYLLLIVISSMLTSTSSALMVRSSMDFSGRFPAQALCFALHMCQLSLVWRFGKLVLLYDKKDWFELTSLRLINIAIQTLPFLAVHGYITFSDMQAVHVVYVLALAVAVLSAAMSLTLFCVREQLHASSWGDLDVTSGNNKRYFGISLLFLGTTIALTTRFACIVLMCLVVQYLVLVPILLHMMILVFGYMSCKAVKSQTLALKDVLVRIGLSYLNIFELVEQDIQHVQCKYVSFYTVILVENIVMVAVWLMKSDVDYITKLIVMVIILVLFICALVLKFASCGFITTTCKAQLIQTGTPDNATISEGKKIIEANSGVPSVSSAVPQVISATLTENIQHHSESPDAEEPVTWLPGNSDQGSAHIAACTRSDSKPKVIRNKASVYNRGSESPTDYGTGRSETQESYSIDDATHGSKYRSSDTGLDVPQSRSKSQILLMTHRERSEVSLDICSSNSRNTNTVFTSAIDASQPAVTKTKSKNSKKIIFPLRTMSSRWKKFNLRLPSMSNLLVRSHTFRPQPGPETVEHSVSPWGDSDTLSFSAVPRDQGLHTAMVSTEEPADITSEAENRTCPAGHAQEKDESLKGYLMSKEDRVQLWLADIRARPPPTCTCSSESHSSDCTYLAKPPAQDLPKFEDFLANVPNHPEISFVISSKQHHFHDLSKDSSKTRQPSLKQIPSVQLQSISAHSLKAKASNPFPLLNPHTSLSQTILKYKDERLSSISKPGVTSRRKLKQERVCFKDLPEDLSPSGSKVRPRPRSVVERQRPESEVLGQMSPARSKHRRCVSETVADSIDRMSSVSSPPGDRHGPATGPYCIRLGDMESLV